MEVQTVKLARQMVGRPGVHDPGTGVVVGASGCRVLGTRVVDDELGVEAILAVTRQVPPIGANLTTRTVFVASVVPSVAAIAA